MRESAPQHHKIALEARMVPLVLVCFRRRAKAKEAQREETRAKGKARVEEKERRGKASPSPEANGAHRTRRKSGQATIRMEVLNTVVQNGTTCTHTHTRLGEKAAKEVEKEVLIKWHRVRMD